MEDEDHVVVDIIDTTQTRRQQQLKLKRCALRLLTAGVTIKAKLPDNQQTSTSGFGLSCFSFVWNILCGVLFWLCSVFLVNGKHFDADDSHEEVEMKGLDFYFKFKKGKLEIEQLHITNTTKSKWYNLIAWEHHKKYKYFSRFASSYNDKDRHESQQNTRKIVSGGKFTWAASIFNGLICSADDVQLLKAFIFKQMWRTVWTSFTYRQEWLLTFLNRNYNFVAMVVSVLAVVQTVYTILAYYFPK
ncbi:hypothetical protein MtrunA17_Chr7g0242001 [Medicago truncatula]|uniref:Transmembrane protein n=1 Tax=Medicago truncatula TaxID=3880 RepID=A0A396GZ89_MEDTR|nr:hypothetical protein MtrunA17_Chr7g0242001 [Medicago truncatula]